METHGGNAVGIGYAPARIDAKIYRSEGDEAFSDPSAKMVEESTTESAAKKTREYKALSGDLRNQEYAG